MIRRRITAAVLCLGMLAGTAASAEAARKYASGSYKGKTAQGHKISLKVLSSKRALIKFNWARADMSCSDGESRFIRGGQSPASYKFPIKKNGTFRITGNAAGGSAEFAIEGKLKGKRAKGVLQVQASAEQEDGSVLTCDSDLVQWSAKRK